MNLLAMNIQTMALLKMTFRTIISLNLKLWTMNLLTMAPLTMSIWNKKSSDNYSPDNKNSDINFFDNNSHAITPLPLKIPTNHPITMTLLIISLLIITTFLTPFYENN